MASYILQILFFQLLFLLVYECLLKKETFFNYNRCYLLLTAVGALLLPLIKIGALSTIVPADAITGFSSIWLPEVYIGTGAENVQRLAAGETTSAQAEINWWVVAYFTGLAGSLFLLIRKHRNLRKLFSFRTISVQGDVKIIEVPDSRIACTFFQTIFLGDKLSGQERKQILSHELVHVKQKHSLDLIFFEFLKVITWFNPLLYVYQSRIVTLHEFIADATVVKHVEKRDYYEQLLNSAFSTTNVTFINQFFNHSLIKKRIVMLQKSKSKAIAKLKYLVLVPLMLVMLTYVSCTQEKEESLDHLDLEQYSYTLQEGEEMTAEIEAIHKRYENFLQNNPDYVSWATIDHKTGEISYSVHPKEEVIPEGYTDLKYVSPDGVSYVSYMNLLTKDSSNSDAQRPQDMSAIKEVVFDGNGIPYGDVEQGPVFSECRMLSSNEEKKKCTSEKIQQFVQVRFNTNLGEDLGLTGMNRIVVVFKIDELGDVVEVKARAPHPKLEEEAIRVVSSLPKMIPGEQDGKKVNVAYSLPIVFQMAKK